MSVITHFLLFTAVPFEEEPIQMTRSKLLRFCIGLRAIVCHEQVYEGIDTALVSRVYVAVILLSLLIFTFVPRPPNVIYF